MEPCTTPAAIRAPPRQGVSMALASITYRWPDGSSVDLVVDSDDDSSHPDLLDELVARVLVLYRSTCQDSGE